MKSLKKAVFAALVATTGVVGAASVSSDAFAHHDPYHFTYNTKYGYVEFWNYDYKWPVYKKIPYKGYWHECKFWKSKYSCDYKQGGYGKGHGGGYGGGYGKSKGYGGGYSSGY